MTESVQALKQGPTGSALRLSAGNLQRAIVSGDFNGDGYVDLAMANEGTETLSVMLGDGHGRFRAGQDYPTLGHGAIALATADFNGDGFQDLAVVNRDSGDVSVLLGNGNGTFQSSSRYSTGGGGNRPGSVVVADFNNDGNADLALTNEASGSVSILLGLGNGTFQASREFAAESDASSIAAADFNGDERTDLLVVNRSAGTISILLGNGDGSFQAPVTTAVGPDPAHVLVEDWNGDGRPDVAVAHENPGSFQILIGKGDGAFLQPVEHLVTGRLLSLVTGDFNGDGILDLLSSVDGDGSLASKTVVWEGKGDGTFSAASPVLGTTALVASVVGDFNGDGRLDIAGIGRNGGVFLLLGSSERLHSADKKPGAAFALGTNSITVGSAAGTGTDLLAAAGPWTASSNSSWLHLTASNMEGAGNAVVSFTYDANVAPTPQTGTLTIAGLTLAVTQAGSGYVAASPINSLISGVNAPAGVAVDALGNVYVADTGNSAIEQWNPLTGQLVPLVTTGLANPGGVAVDSQSNVYIADTGNSAIEEWTAATQQFSVLISTGLLNPHGVAVDGQGNVYIADTGNNAIEEWNASTQQFSVLVAAGLNGPQGVAVDLLGNVYIADTGNNAVEQWNVSTQQLATLVATGVSGPSGVAVDGQGNVYIADTQDSEGQEWNAATQQLAPLQSTGLNLPAGIAVDAAGNVYVADTGNSAVKEINFAYVGPTALSERAAAGNDVVQVVPSTTVFMAASDQAWLSLTGTTGGVAAFSFSSDTSVTSRTAHVSLLGVSVTVTQAGDAVATLNKSAGDVQSMPLGQTFPIALSVKAVDLQGNPVQGAAVSFTVVNGSGGASGVFGATPPMPVVTDANGNATAPTLTGNFTAGGFTVVASTGSTTAVFTLTNVSAALGATSTTVSGTGGSGSVLLQVVPPGASWSAVSNSTWLHISPGSASGTGAALVQFTFDPNTGSSVETGTLTIGGQTFTVTEAGSGFVTISEVTSLISQGLNLPFAIAMDGQGNLYIADTGHNAIQKWTAATQQMTPLVSTGLDAPHGVALDGYGNVYIADAYHNAVEEWVAATGLVMTLVSTGLNFPLSVAVDGQGNVYIADFGDNAIKEWSPATLAVTTLVASALKGPTGVGVDSLGNVYIADFGDSAIKEWNPLTQQVTTLGTGLSFPNSVTLDGEDNLYLIDGNNNALKEWSAASQTMNLLASGVTGSFGLATDGQGNFYVASTSASAIEKISLAYLGLGATVKNELPPAGTDTVSVQVLPPNTPLSLSSDQAWLTITGNTGGVIAFSFTANTSVSGRTAHISIQGQQVTVVQSGDTPATIAKTAGDGQTASPSQVFSAPLQVTVTDSLGAPVSGALITFTVTPGITGASGTLASTQPVATNGSGVATAPAITANTTAGSFTVTAAVNGLTAAFTLSINASFALGDTSVTVGGSAGAGTVLLVGNSSWTATSNSLWLQVSTPSGTGNGVVGFTYLANSSASPQTGTLTIAGLTFVVNQAGAGYAPVLPVTTIASGLNHPQGVGVDSSGNVYIADTANNAVKEWNATTLVVSTLVSAGLNGPTSVAVDSSGNVYISDTGNKAIKEWSVTTKLVTTLVSAGLGSPRGIAIDTSGDLFIADASSNAVYEWNVSTQTLIPIVTSGLSGPTAVAVDRLGNVYIADAGNNAVKKWTSSNGQVTSIVTGLSGPTGVAVDGQGNVDIDDTGNSALKQWNAGTQVVKILVSTGLSGPSGVAVDSQTNIYLADTNNNAIKKLWFGYVLPGSTARTESALSGTDSVSTQVIPAGTPLTAASDSTWLTITGVPAGAVNFSFVANTSASSRVAHITIVSPQVTVTQNGDVPVLLTPFAGNNQSTPPGTAFTTLLEATVTDSAGLPVQGASVTFTTTAGATGAIGTFASASPVITDQNGHATASVLTANLIGGSFTATASSSGAPSAIFSLANLTYSLGGSSVGVGSASGGDSVELVANGAWTGVSNASWLHLGSISGTTGGVILFTYDANTATTSRTGSLTFSGLTFTVTQAGTSYTALSLSTTIVPTGLKTPEGVAVDTKGNAYIADTGDNAIKEWVSSNQTVNSLVISGLLTPYGVGVDTQGNVYIADSKDNDVKELTLSTGAVTALVSSGLSVPFGVGVDSQGNVYFSDSGHNAIKEWILTSKTVSTLVSTGLNGPRGIAVDSLGNVYFCDTGNNAVKEWNATTKLVTALVSGLNAPSGVAVDGEGNIYIADTGNNAIKRFDPSGSTLTVLISTGLKSPSGVAVDTQGNLYIADTGDSVVDKVILGYSSLGATSRTELATAGTDSVSVQIIPSTITLSATSDQTWLTISSISGGLINFAFTANTSISSRVAHITILGQQITITQKGDAVSSVTKTAGNSQSVAVNTTYPTSLQVQVKDAQGNPISGASVTFTTTAGSKGSNGTFSSTAAVITNSTGFATASALKANSVAGTFTATATVGGMNTVFSLTITSH